MEEIGKLIGKLIGCLIMAAIVLLCAAAVVWCWRVLAGLVA